jgi:chromosome segregation ATPase
MPNTDFFDDDLMKQHSAARRVKLDAVGETGDVVGELSGAEEGSVRSVSDFNLTRLAKHKQEVSDQAAAASHELEKLRKRQEDLEREKRELEDLRRKQDDYERGKREMVDRLNSSVTSLEKDELEAERLAELLGATRKRFKNLLMDIEAIHEENWPEAQMRDELAKALNVLEDARLEYNKTMTKIEALSGDARKISAEIRPVIFEEGKGSVRRDSDQQFGFWLKVGLAASLPLMITILLVAAVFVALRLACVL